MLARWVIIPADDSRARGARIGDGSHLFTPVSIVDPEYDLRWIFSGKGHIALPAEATGADHPGIKKALAAYAAANGGRSPRRMQDLFPYADNREVMLAIIEANSRRQATHEER